MLGDEIKQEIQAAYSSLLASKGYQARYCQRRMIADIANTLGNIETDENGARSAGGHICVVEAGTGTGKTVAYAVAALPIARALGKRLVIATATVALQEQIVHIDLPDIRDHAGLAFDFALAKGRRRYLCLARLDQLLQAAGPVNQTLALYDDERFGAPADAEGQALYESMLTQLGRGDWDGDRDSWPDAIDDRLWYRVSTDHVQCTGRQCSHFHNCYFYKARESIHKVDCIVTNQDLVLADLMMGGGAVLPAPEDTIYIFDEGHHLPDKAVSHFANFLQLRSTLAWLEHVPASLSRMTAELAGIADLAVPLERIEDNLGDLIQSLQSVMPVLESFRQSAQGEGDERRYRFVGGEVADALRQMCAQLHAATAGLAGLIDMIERDVEARLGDADSAAREPLERWLPVVAGMSARLGSGASLWQDFMHADDAARPPRARWINFSVDDLTVSASPVAVDELLRQLLWSRCHGAVVTSATLAVAGNFARYRKRAGIDEDNTFNALPSPFRYGEQAVLRVPKMTADPRDIDAHNDCVAEMLPAMLDGSRGGLVLFTSWRQMHRVTELLPAAFLALVLSQGTLSKAEIVQRHKSSVDRGETSIIFGLASFAEGIDLPGDYCDHVVVVKIPFSVPDDPVGATLSEWIEARGGNAFQEIMIPDAALRMVQACGRLLRTESDTGTITILDRRLVTQRYGKLLLAALPPFRREIA